MAAHACDHSNRETEAFMNYMKRSPHKQQQQKAFR